MILIDLSQLAISNLMMSQGLKKGEVDEGLIKHMILNSIRMYNVKFRAEYGELVICCDSKEYWRKDIFPEYKAHRKAARKKSKFDWKEVFTAIRNFKEDLKEFFPYKVIEVDKAEGDDVVAILAKFIKDEKTIIIGSDKDYTQLQLNPHITQYSPTKKEFLTSENPDFDLFELIVKGDKGDGIPNIRSSNDTFMSDKRQKPIKEKEIKEWYGLEPERFCSDMDMFNNFKRNQELIDFDYIPDSIIQSVLEEHKQVPKGNKNTIMQYFSANRMRLLIEYIGDF